MVYLTITNVFILFIIIWIITIIFFYIENKRIWGFNYGMASLLKRTFDEYYKGDHIKLVGTNWGIDFIYDPNNEGDEKAKAFATLFYGKDSGINTPIEDVVEADKVASEIVRVIEKYIQQKELYDN